MSTVLPKYMDRWNEVVDRYVAAFNEYQHTPSWRFLKKRGAGRRCGDAAEILRLILRYSEEVSK